MAAGASLSTMVGVWGDRTSHSVDEKAEIACNPKLADPSSGPVPGSLDPMS